MKKIICVVLALLICAPAYGADKWAQRFPTGTPMEVYTPSNPPPGSMTYPGAGIAKSTGSAWATSVTDNSANWNTAYGWGNHAGLYLPIASTPWTGMGYLTAEVDPKVGTLTSGKWCTSNGSVIACTSDAPAGAGDVTGPATNTDGYIPLWNGANSKALKNGIDPATLLLATGATVGATSQAQVFTSGIELGTVNAVLGTAKFYGNTSGNVSVKPQAAAGTNIVLTLPNTAGTIAASASSPIALSATTGQITHVNTAGNKHIPTGGSANQILKNSGTSGTGAWGTVTESSGALAAVTTIGMSGQLTSTLATGSAPFVVASTTPVANLSIGGNAGTVTNGVYTTDAGTVFLAPNGSAASLTSFPTLNQDTTGTAAKATSNILTASPTSQTGTGMIVGLTYGESITLGDLLYYKSDSKVYKADATSIATAKIPCIGLALATASSGTNNVLLRGIYKDSTKWTGGTALTVGGVAYLSATAGATTQTQPSSADNVIQVVGVATATDTLYFNPSGDYITHT